ncbi:MAG: hypothetical protein KGI02_03310 [Thaumarchaeota archaeon]|nr:hypothetical protein [Nitrososphaerota archaeon]MDE1831381.1 hypothetical protein [Nitrososphaerota archaeon]MDE1876915.1 hypothetical protein [Nitrososphaerota archaeon]
MDVIVMKNALQSVFRNPRYVVISILISVFTFFIFIFVNNFSTFVTAISLGASPTLLLAVTTNGAVNIFDASGAAMFTSIIVISILSGITISMIIYQLRVTGSFGGKKNFASFGGIFGGAFSSACSACSTTLASILGAAGGLAIFPLKGLEFSLPSIGILVASMYFISKGLMKSGKCKI